MTDLVALEAPRIRARRRLSAVAILWVWDGSLGLVLGGCIASVARGAYGRSPLGDAGLFAPGGLELLDLLRHSRSAAGPLLCEALVIAALAHFGGLVPAAAAAVELGFSTRARRPPPIREAVSRALLAFPTLLRISLVALAVEATVVACGVLVAALLSRGALERFGERGGDTTVAAIVGAACAVASVVGVIADLARAVVMRREATAIQAGSLAWSALRARPVAIFWSYAWRAASGCLPVATGAILSTRVGGRGGAALLALAWIHQIIVVARASIRASWTARALRAVA